MADFLLAHEQMIRLSVFGGMLAIMTVLELVSPFRSSLTGPVQHRVANLAISILNSVLLQLVFPFLAVGMAYMAAEKGWGLFNVIDFPPVLEIIAALLLFDVAIYGQHVVTHKVPFLWRFHGMHHTDRDLDATTGIRFHPVEILLSMGWKFLLVVMIGPAPVAVMLFEVILNATALFNHGNIRLPRRFEPLVRLLIITPEMHRVHHSIHRSETDSNYGFSLSVWDRLFGTYRARSIDGDEGLTIGLPDKQTAPSANPVWMLLFPFRR